MMMAEAIDEVTAGERRTGEDRREPGGRRAEDRRRVRLYYAWAAAWAIIGAIVVLGPGNRITGIISERDIVRNVASGGIKALDEPVGQAMTREVATCGISDSIEQLMQRMTDGKFRHLPVIEDGELAGIISIGDVVKYRLAEIEAETQAIRDYIATA